MVNCHQPLWAQTKYNEWNNFFKSNSSSGSKKILLTCMLMQKFEVEIKIKGEQVLR